MGDIMGLRPLRKVPSYSPFFPPSPIMTQWILLRDHTPEFQRGVLSFLFTAFAVPFSFVSICLALPGATNVPPSHI